MKDKEARIDDFSQVFASIQTRINEKRTKENQIIVLDHELEIAVTDYCTCYKDFVTYKGG